MPSGTLSALCSLRLSSSRCQLNISHLSGRKTLQTWVFKGGPNCLLPEPPLRPADKTRAAAFLSPLPDRVFARRRPKLARRKVSKLGIRILIYLSKPDWRGGPFHASDYLEALSGLT